MLPSPFPVCSSEEKEAEEEENYNRNTQKSTTGHGYVMQHTSPHIVYCTGLNCVALAMTTAGLINLIAEMVCFVFSLQKGLSVNLFSIWSFLIIFQELNTLCLLAFRLR